MGRINAAVELSRRGAVALVVMDNPPVNALGHALREGIAEALRQAEGDGAVRAVVLAGTQRAFSGGADITEFGGTRKSPTLRDLIPQIEAMTKPVVAAIHGLALGGGLELALGCHYRVAWAGARLGLPEIKLGLLPGAGGTVLLPRLVGAEAALRIILTGDPVLAERAGSLVDAVLDGVYPDAAIAWAEGMIGKPLRRVRDRDEALAPARADPGLIDRAAAPLLRRHRGAPAASACVEAVRRAVTVPYAEAMAAELESFMALMGSDESRAQRHAFFAEREARKLPDMPAGVQPVPVRRAVVIGAGTMGGGIAMCFANAGIPVTLIETAEDALARGLDRVRGNYETAVKRGSLPAEAPTQRMALIDGTTEFDRAAEGDLAIEAVFEEMDLKRRLFAALDAVAKPGAILATNTSTLDVNEIAASTRRPEAVLGMHFFSPANVMRLLEIVRGAKTSFEALATALAVAPVIGKVPVVVGVCDGFVGNRMLHKRGVQAERMLLEGASPQEIDRALTDFGFPMGPFAMSDLAGLDVGWRIRRARGQSAPVADALCEAGRFGQKTGAGYYRYEGREPTPDPEVDRIAGEAAEKLQIRRRKIGPEEILDRLLLPMLNEAARILEEGIAIRPGDIDVVWLNGYGWPAYRGGPMWYADRIGSRRLRDRLRALAEQTGDASLRPAALIERLAETDAPFLGVRA
ncbi:MAG TPA: 3-hydroxyacyl-CoA dehydrogenase NAD-binding domain-containing protein [Acetobacteraceae bacterium]|nr:3-hydroxyacyl-CoA dehydrogenase NAD-binding domain-containing protein [Acetobacteraceae bacterium]